MVISMRNIVLFLFYFVYFQDLCENQFLQRGQITFGNMYKQDYRYRKSVNYELQNHLF